MIFNRPSSSALSPRQDQFYTNESLQNLLANISAGQQAAAANPNALSQLRFTPPTLAPVVPPPLSDSSNSPDALTNNSREQPTTSREQQVGLVPPKEDRRNSSIAVLRLKAREHEIKLEQMRRAKEHNDE